MPAKAFTVNYETITFEIDAVAINGFGRIGRSFVKAALKVWILYNLLPSIGLMLQQKREDLD
jgi:hypothetical protein